MALILWLGRTPPATLRDQLRQRQFWSLELQFVLVLALSSLNLPALVRAVGLRSRDFITPLAAAALAFALATWAAPKTSRIFYDEQIYQSVAQNLTDLKLAQMCNDGNVEYGALKCARGEYSKEPYGYPYLLSVAYRLVGVRDGVASFVNTLAVPVLVIVLFATTTVLTRQPVAGGFSALIAALIPEQLRWSHTAAAEPSAALVCAGAVLTALAFVRLRTTSALLWMVAATAFAVQFRPECALIAAVVVAVVVLCAPEEFLHPRLWCAGLLAVALLSVHAGHMFAVRHEGWGTPGPRISLTFLRANLSANGWFYLGDARFPVVYTVLALAALVLWRGGRAAAIPVLHFALFWGIFLVFYAGSYNYGADERFSLMTYPPLAVLAGIGAWRIAELWAPEGWTGFRTQGVVAAVLLAQFLWYLPLVRTVGEEAWAARVDVDFAKAITADLPRNAIVLTHNPNMFHVWGQSAAQAAIAATEAGYVDNVLEPRYAGGVFFHWNFWCNVADPVQQAFCANVLQRFPHTLVREHRERNYVYALYRLRPVRPSGASR